MNSVLDALADELAILKDENLLRGFNAVEQIDALLNEIPLVGRRRLRHVLRETLKPSLEL